MTALIVRAGILVFAVLLIAGCGGDDELTDAQYFEQMQEIGDGIDQASESLFAAVGPLLATPREATALAAFAVAADEFARVMRDAASEIGDLRPPADIADAHAEAVASFAETSDRFGELAAAAHEGQSADELQPLLEAAFASHQSSATRVALTDLAAEHGLALDLGCDTAGDGAAAPSRRTDVAASAEPRRSPPPALAIVGGELRNSYGERVVLRGVAIADPEFMGTRFDEKRYSAEDIEELARNWGVNVIRVPIHPTSWAWDPEYSARHLDALVRWGAESGIYIFLGWHAHGNPITGEVEQPRHGAVPNDRNPYNPDLELAKAALGELAERYRDNPWVLYGTFNEPSHITWRAWRPLRNRGGRAPSPDEVRAVTEAMREELGWAGRRDALLVELPFLVGCRVNAALTLRGASVTRRTDRRGLMHVHAKHHRDSGEFLIPAALMREIDD